jgi:hypothetical protein
VLELSDLSCYWYAVSRRHSTGLARAFSSRGLTTRSRRTAPPPLNSSVSLHYGKIMKSDGKLSDADHNAMDSFLGRVLDAYKAGGITRQSAISGLAHVIAAVDIDNHPEAISWFEQKGVEFFK